MPASCSLIRVIASQNISSTLSLDEPITSTRGTPASSRRTTLASGSSSPVHHSWRMAKSSNRSPSSVSRKAPRRLAAGTRAHHSARQYGPSYCRGGVADLPFFHLNGVGWPDAVVGLCESVCLLAVEIDPLDAVSVFLARRHHVHGRHRCPSGPSIAGSQFDSTARLRPQNCRSSLARVGSRNACHLDARRLQCDTHHCGNICRFIDSIADYFLLFRSTAASSPTGGISHNKA